MEVSSNRATSNINPFQTGFPPTIQLLWCPRCRLPAEAAGGARGVHRVHGLGVRAELGELLRLGAVGAWGWANLGINKSS